MIRLKCLRNFSECVRACKRERGEWEVYVTHHTQKNFSAFLALVLLCSIFLTFF